jgi:hypothetical protein
MATRRLVLLAVSAATLSLTESASLARETESIRPALAAEPGIAGPLERATAPSAPPGVPPAA